MIGFLKKTQEVIVSQEIYATAASFFLRLYC